MSVLDEPFPQSLPPVPAVWRDAHLGFLLLYGVSHREIPSQVNAFRMRLERDGVTARCEGNLA